MSRMSSVGLGGGGSPASYNGSAERKGRGGRAANDALNIETFGEDALLVRILSPASFPCLRLTPDQQQQHPHRESGRGRKAARGGKEGEKREQNRKHAAAATKASAPLPHASGERIAASPPTQSTPLVRGGKAVRSSLLCSACRTGRPLAGGDRERDHHQTPAER
jgi:hypothetical protein